MPFKVNNNNDGTSNCRITDKRNVIDLQFTLPTATADKTCAELELLGTRCVEEKVYNVENPNITDYHALQDWMNDCIVVNYASEKAFGYAGKLLGDVKELTKGLLGL